MHDCTVSSKEDDAVDRIVETDDIRKAVGEVKGGLVIGAGDGGNGNAAPTAGDRSMHMTEEDVAHIPMTGDRLRQLSVVEDPVLIEARHSDRHRRMVHEQIDGLTGSLGQRTLEPLASFRTVGARMNAGIYCVEEQKHASRSGKARLQEAVLVGFDLGKRFT